MARLFDDAATEYFTRSSAPVTPYPVSMACWFYADDASLVGTLMALDTAAGESILRMVVVGVVSPKQIRANTRDSAGGESNAITSAWAVNTWHHALAVFAASNDRRIYLDGGNKVSDTTTGT